MGMYKELQIKYQDQGFIDCDNRVCWKCINDKYIQKTIKNSKELTRCDYCGRPHIKTVKVTNVLEKIMKVIDSYYLLANDFSGNQSHDSFDIIDNLNNYLGIENENLLHDLCESIPDSYVDNFYDTSYIEKVIAWDDYCESIKKIKRLSASQIISLSKKKSPPEAIKRAVAVSIN